MPLLRAMFLSRFLRTRSVSFRRSRKTRHSQKEIQGTTDNQGHFWIQKVSANKTYYYKVSYRAPDRNPLNPHGFNLALRTQYYWHNGVRGADG